MESIKQILISRDNMSPSDADDLIAEAREALQEYLDAGNAPAAENICEEYFSLEPDYIDELL
jgi:hypothetical protein